MLFLVLLLAVVIPFPLCLFRMKKYDFTFTKMLFIYVVFSFMGACGAFVGSILSGGPWNGIRLYGLMLFDSICVVLVSRLLKVKILKLGDFVAPPLLAVCFSAKIMCFLTDCCRGIILSTTDNGEVIRFPSAIVEMAIWLGLTVCILLLEKSKHAKNLLWPIALTWFGILRFLADFFRGSSLERSHYLIGLTAGMFWSMIVAVIGLVYMYYAVKTNKKRRPKVIELIKALFGYCPN
ncbi:MAG: prolipoprotein diacylglyceryl transferase [Clostridia bacterium]|nr:prolipoprotein diacylglyceryl transferase [Clostridia bacterium]